MPSPGQPAALRQARKQSDQRPALLVGEQQCTVRRVAGFTNRRTEGVANTSLRTYFDLLNMVMNAATTDKEPFDGGQPVAGVFDGL